MGKIADERKVWHILLPILFGATLAACATGANLQEVPDRPISACGPEAVLFHVATEAGPVLPKVRVRAVTRQGWEELGETNKLGQICLAESKVNSPEVECLLFCRSGYFCGAFIPREEPPGFREHLIALARLALP